VVENMVHGPELDGTSTSQIRMDGRRGCSYAACQKRALSHAASVPPSSGSKRHASQPQTAQIASLASCHTTFTEQIYLR
jgi:hypothetical protein